MRKILFIIFAVFCISSCSVEPIDPYLEDGLYQELKMTAQDDNCVTVHSFGDAGTITVTNDGDFLLVTITASGAFSLTEARLQVSDDYNDFPTVGKGNLPPGKMEKHKKFNPGAENYTWQFPLSDNTESVVIASFSTFTNAEGSMTSWAGDKEIKFGNWAYFEYEIVECAPACDTPNLGENVVLNYSYIESLSTDEQDLQGALGFYDDGFPTDGTFEPGLEILLERIKENSGDEAETFSTTYTVGEGECIASVNLTINVACPSAGDDKTGTLEYNCADNLNNLEHLRNIYLSLLEDGVKTDGNFDPSMQQISYEFEKLSESEAIGKSFTTTYTVGSGECIDTVDLTITIIESNDEEGACKAYEHLM